VAHNLRKLDLVQEAFPFDWIKINSIKMIINTLELSFSNFFKYELIEQSSNFFNETNLSELSLIKLKLSNGMILPHEALGYTFNEKEYKEKYFRRIERFNTKVFDRNIHKVFVRGDDRITDIEKSMLYSALDKYGVVNYSVKFISYSEYLDKIQSDKFDWKREYVNWNI
jgi:hypothetical protein